METDKCEFVCFLFAPVNKPWNFQLGADGEMISSFHLGNQFYKLRWGWLKLLNCIFISILLMWQQDFVGTLVKISFKMVVFEWVCLHIFLKVFNLIVDSKKVESVIVTDRLNAERLFSRPDQVPRNASKIITPDFFEYNPPIRGILHLG